MSPGFPAQNAHPSDNHPLQAPSSQADLNFMVTYSKNPFLSAKSEVPPNSTHSLSHDLLISFTAVVHDFLFVY